MSTENKKKSKAGRPSTTVKQRLEKITFDIDKVKEIARFGCTDAQLAKILDVSEETIRRWKNDSPEFVCALKDAKAEADAEVEKSLYRRATGYTHESVKIFCNANGEVTQVPFVEHYPPDATSMIFWLKNRQPDRWREKHEIDLGEKTFEFIIGKEKGGNQD